MVVSLEAIFLSTFVMFSQNRADAKRRVIADEQWHTVEEEEKQNDQLTDISNEILALTNAIHDYTSAQSKRAGRRARKAEAIDSRRRVTTRNCDPAVTPRTRAEVCRAVPLLVDTEVSTGDRATWAS